MEIELKIDLSAGENARMYFDRAKKLEEKVRRAKERMKEKGVEKKRGKERKKEWYEKFYWSFTSGGRLIIGGRDARTNREVLKRMEKNDLFFHADLHGAPHVILKDGKNASEEEIREAAIFAGCFSSAWKRNLSLVPVYWVYPDQVSLSPPSGEYLPRGAVMIYGKRNYLEVELKLAVCPGFVGAESAARKRCNRYVLIVPGEERDRRRLEEILDTKDIPPLPPGGFEILGVKRA